MRAVIVDVHYITGKVGQVEVLRRAEREIAERGIELRFWPDREPGDSDAPLIVTHHYAMRDGFSHLTRPTVVLEKFDAAGPYARDYPTCPHVLAIVKHGVLKPSLMATAPPREHVGRINGQPTTCKPVEPHVLAKYVSGLTFGQYDRHAAMAKQSVDLTEARPVDVFFAGSMASGVDEVANHRRRCVDVLRSLRGLNVVVHEGRGLSASEYRAACLRAKVMVSPWGYGELCHRDYEALLSGCVLVKPDSRHITTASNVLKHAIHCRHDWSDLPQRVAEAMDLWPAMDLREAGLTAARKLWKPSTAAKQVERIMQSVEVAYARA